MEMVEEVMTPEQVFEGYKRSWQFQQPEMNLITFKLSGNFCFLPGNV